MVRVLRAPSRGGASLPDSQPSNEDDSSNFRFGSDGSGDSDDASQEPSFSFCEDDLIPSDVDRPSDPFHASSSHFQSAFFEQDPDRLYSKATDDGVEARITVKRTLLVSEPRELRQTPATPKAEDPANDERKGRRVSRSIAALRRRSKSSTRASEPRDQSTGDNNVERLVDVLSPSQSDRSESARRRKSRPPTSNPEERDSRGVSGGLSRKSSRPTQKRPEPVPAAPPIGKAEQPPSSSPEQPPSTPVLKSGSSSRASAPSKNERQTSRIAPLPGTILRRAQQRSFNPMAKRNDELWNAFRNLESDYVKFESKTASVKATFVRTSLLPFLQSYATHRSNDDLAPEDLERRVRILSKWWNGLLDLLLGQAGLQLTGFDRPAVMDGLSGIMERPEWRQPLSEFSPLKKRTRPEAQMSGSSQQLGSTEDNEFLLESVHHNTRNLFVHYLFRQMTYVVDKMSLKNVPMSLVTFCGKCCAFAMFFCPGMADVLVRLWDVPARNIKRAAESFGLEKPVVSPKTSDLVLQAFPRCMQMLGFTSYRSTVVNLRKKPVLPMGFEKIPWRCSWTERWTGKESDLFYVFVRHYHLLLVDFLREDAPKEEIACAPVCMLVRAQIISNIDATLRRYEKPASTEPIDGLSIGSNFNETLNGEGSAFGLSAVPSNAARLIKSNRLIMLMRSFLSEKSTADPTAQRLFAGCVCEALQAATRATSPFDQGACLAICDLLEEYFMILGKFEANDMVDASSWNWSFWFDVFTRMARSDNTLIMIRLIALVYTAWPIITKDARRKAELCSKYLLDQDIFLSHFNHWCPMVRSYYMRLLAWRVARCDGTATKSELEIMEALHQRSLETWCFFKYYANETRKQGREFPSTAPSNPAPGRRLLIIRTDRHIIPSPLLDSPGSPSEPSGRAEQVENKYWPVQVNGFSPAQLFEKLSLSLEQGADSGKRKSGLFRTISSFRSSESRSPLKDKESATSNPPVELSEPNEDTSASETSSRTSLYEQRPLIPPRLQENQAAPGQRGKKMGKEEILAAKGIRMEALAEFRFSIEGSDRGPTRLPRDLTLSPPKLPHPAQAQVQAVPGFNDDPPQQKPTGASAICVRYSGRALAEWALVVNECQNFFDRRIAEGVSAMKFVETPILSAEPFKRI